MARFNIQFLEGLLDLLLATRVFLVAFNILIINLEGVEFELILPLSLFLLLSLFLMLSLFLLLFLLLLLLVLVLQVQLLVSDILLLLGFLAITNLDIKLNLFGW